MPEARRRLTYVMLFRVGVVTLLLIATFMSELAGPSEGGDSARTLMVGDSRIDYETARSAATRCCLVAYGFSGHTLEGVPTDGAWIATDPSTLADIISRFIASG